METPENTEEAPQAPGTADGAAGDSAQAVTVVVFRAPCRHEEAGTPHAGAVPDYKPMTRDQVTGLLVRAASAKDWRTVSRLQLRLVQAMPGITCPRPADGPVAERLARLGSLYAGRYREGGTPDLTDAVQAILTEGSAGELDIAATVAFAVFEDVADAIAARNPELDRAGCRETAQTFFTDTARWIRAGMSETPPWSEHPFTGSLAQARARVEEVAGLPAAVQHGVRAAPEVIEAAARTLALPPDDRCVSVIAAPAAVWDIDGTMTAVYHYQTPDGPVTGSWCGCGHWDGPCEHLLIALAGTRQPETEPAKAKAMKRT